MTATIGTKIRQAATVVLARDGSRGIEVFMLLRNSESAFAPGCYVFPGGALEVRDRHPGIADFCAGPSDEEASARIGVPHGGLAYWHAAIRECFEEAGLLLAVDKDGAMFSAADPETRSRFAAYRRAVYDGRRELFEICGQEGLRLAAGSIAYFSHWITPEGAPRRFDTRFFVGKISRDHEGHHDDGETVGHIWISPEEALARNSEGTFRLLRPTISTLKSIAGMRNSDELMQMVTGKTTADADAAGNRLRNEDGTPAGAQKLPGYWDVIKG